MTAQRLFAGKTLRALRERRGLRQAAMADLLAISVSYLSQLENDDRPLTAPLIARLSRRFDLDLTDLGQDSADARAEALRRAASDPVLGAPLDETSAARAVRQQPHLAERFIALHRAYRDVGERLQMLDEAFGASGQSRGPEDRVRLPWEEVRDWFHAQGNYVDAIDRAAEAIAARMPDGLEHFATSDLGLTLVAAESGMRRYDRAARTLHLDAALPAETRRFQIATQVADIALSDAIGTVVRDSGLDAATARDLLEVGLRNYAAGALLMPYARFREAALTERHDIDRLSWQFSVSFEQACHRLSTLQRDGARGIPVFFCRVDMAGNITKRHSATPLQFARFGGACPLWSVHEAVAIPDRILTQLVEMPDGVRYVSMAKGLVKPSRSYARPPRRYAVALGCEARDAADFIYADGLDMGAGPTKIGVSCRICPREACDQRAFPPGDRTIAVDPDERGVVPYRIA